MSAAAVTASILVCTLDRAELLDGCLRSILEDGSAVGRELIVVDNGPSEATREVVARHASEHPEVPVRYDVEPQRGHAYARNRGVGLAEGELILFADDDVLVEPGWADAMASAFDDPAIAAAGGRILPRWSSPPPPWLRYPHSDMATLPDYGTSFRLLGGWELPVGANSAIRKAALEELGLAFSTDLGHRGKAAFGFEEFDLYNRILEDYSIAYVPEALVYHRVDGERVTREGLRRLHYQRGFGTGRWERHNGGSVPPLRPRAGRAVRACSRALRRRVRNSRAAELTADRAWDECRAYFRAGQSIELLFGRFPRFAEWLGTRPV